jgi:hypothetical protein
VFYILDSLPGNISGTNEGAKLQKIVLKHFEDTTFDKGSIVPCYIPVTAIVFNN